MPNWLHNLIALGLLAVIALAIGCATFLTTVFVGFAVGLIVAVVIVGLIAWLCGAIGMGSASIFVIGAGASALGWIVGAVFRALALLSTGVAL